MPWCQRDPGMVDVLWFAVLTCGGCAVWWLRRLGRDANVLYTGWCQLSYGLGHWVGQHAASQALPDVCANMARVQLVAGSDYTLESDSPCCRRSAQKGLLRNG
jgi:hypothetical protein